MLKVMNSTKPFEKLMKTKGNKNIDRREFLKRLGAGAAVSGYAMLVGCDSGKIQ